MPARTCVLGPGLLWYFVLGCLFGIVLIKSEVVSWFRIQEMFRFQSFHMYGIIMSAIATAALSIVILERVHAHTLAGEAISIPPRMLGRGYRYWIGGTMFGVGWALTGACPGPLFALTGGMSIYGVAAGERTRRHVAVWLPAPAPSALLIRPMAGRR